MATAEYSPDLADIWRRIDRIYCISLEERHDRRESARAQFRRVGLDGQVAFFLAQRHPDNSEKGIFESHQACLEMGLAAGARHILMFEDDVIFGAIDPRRLSAGIDYFMEQTDSPYFSFGCLVGKSSPTASFAVRRIVYRCLTHAYLVDADLARRIVDSPWQGLAFDDALRKLAGRHLALYPSIAFQSNSETDNTRLARLDRIRRLFGGLRVIQLLNERYHRHRLLFIGAHVLAIVAIILWILIR